MSKLQNALERILEWNKVYDPRGVSFLKPGLSIAEIDEISQDLPFKLPQVVYELYQWRNGSISEQDIEEPEYDYHGGYTFCDFGFYPLKKVIETCKDRLSSFKPHCKGDYLLDPCWLEVFFRIDLEVFGYVIAEENEKDCLVIFKESDENDVTTEQYLSLTNMMLTIAEYLETGAYYKNDNGRFRWDELKAKAIWQKYNSELEEYLKKQMFLKLQSSMSLRLLNDISPDLIRYKDPRAIPFLLDALENPLPDVIDINEKVGIQALAARILGEMKADIAVEPLILTLRNDSQWLRYWATYALGKLKSEKSRASLMASLQDEDEDVQNMARWAIDQLNTEN